MRLTKNTDDPVWLLSLDQEIDWVGLESLPVIADVRAGVVDTQKLQRFLLQIGKAVIIAFPSWLKQMQSLATPGTREKKFLSANFRQERLHWEWWLKMANFYGVLSQEFQDVNLRPKAARLNEYLHGLTSKDLTLALTGVNYVIETGAARMTASVADTLRQQLDGDSYRWIGAHADGDIEHSADSRELVKAGVLANPSLEPTVRVVAIETHRLFQEALIEAY